MLERIARALALSANGDGFDEPWEPYVADAKAALDAMREPTEAQIRAVDAACHEHWPNARKMAVAMQHAMIDAAL